MIQAVECQICMIERNKKVHQLQGFDDTLRHHMEVMRLYLTFFDRLILSILSALRS